MKIKLSKKLTGNLGLKAIALVIAFLIWLLVTNTNNPRKTQLFNNVPINIVNKDSIADIGKVVQMVGNGTVTLRVEEKRSVLDRLSRGGTNFYVEADMENINEMNMVPLTVTCDNPAVTWDEIEVSPSSLKVKLEDKVEQAFSVSVSTTGATAKGFEVGSTEIVQGKNIYIAGPASVIKIINQVVAPVNVTALNSDMALTSTLKVIDKNGSELTDRQLNSLEFKDSTGAVITDRVVQIMVKVWKVRTDIPMEVQITGSPKFGYSVVGIETIPVTISLAGTDSAFAALDGKLNLLDEVSVAGASDNISQEIDLTDTLSEMDELKLITDAEPMITVNVQIEKNGDTMLSIPMGSVTLLNRPENMELIFTPAEKISIAVHALSEDKGIIEAKDVKASIDLTVCAKEGTYELPVMIELPEGYEVASEVTVAVNSEKQPQDETEAE